MARLKTRLVNGKKFILNEEQAAFVVVFALLAGMVILAAWIGIAA